MLDLFEVFRAESLTALQSKNPESQSLGCYSGGNTDHTDRQTRYIQRKGEENWETKKEVNKDTLRGEMTCKILMFVFYLNYFWSVT